MAAKRWVRAAAAGAALCVCAVPAPAGETVDDAALRARVAEAVDLPTPAERRKAARALAERHGDVPLATWVRVLRSFGPRPGGAPEPRDPDGAVVREVVPLAVLGATEPTEITVYVPPTVRADTPAPLLLAGHGSGGDGRHEHGRWRHAADALGMIVVAPTEASDNAGYAFTARERANTLAALRWARRRWNVDENRIHVTGISRGGHLAWDLGLRHPDRFASLAPMIGGPRLETRNAQNNLRFLANVAHLSIRDLQGEGDDPRMLTNLELAFERLEGLGAEDAQLLRFPGYGHGFRMNAVDWEAFLGATKRRAAPGQVVRWTVHAAPHPEARAHWVEVLRLKRSVRESFTPRFPPDRWNALDDEGKRRLVIAEAERRTAQLRAERLVRGAFVVTSDGVVRFRLLLTAEMFREGEPVEIRWNGATKRKRARPSARVLLEDFVERFDRTFLPIAEVRVP